MSEDKLILKNIPVTFNPLKHHFGYIMQKIAEWQKQDWQITEKELLFMGNNLLDLYYGDLCVNDIIKECYQQFQKENIDNSHKLAIWLFPKEYRKIVLSDSSIWIIKPGTDNDRFIHIHPAKDSPFSIRVRGTTLKTVVALKTETVNSERDFQLNIQAVNRIRTKHLDLSPVKSLETDKGIERIWKIFNNMSKTHANRKMK